MVFAIGDPRFTIPTLSKIGIGTSGIKMYFIYILKSEKNGKYYTGCTNNIEERMKQHNSGFSKYTKNKGLWILVYKEQFDNLVNARRRERQIKSWKKRRAIEKLISDAIV